MAYLFTLSAIAWGDEYVGPLHTPEDAIKAILGSEKFDRKDVKVVLLKYDYLKKEWHIELTPSKQKCLDCYPTYLIEDTEPLKIKKIPHG